MLYCGQQENIWVEAALRYLPDDIWDKINGKIAITVLSGDACRLAQKICDTDEIIILSPWLFSYIPPGSSEVGKEWRYLIFCILHEIAHVVLKHLPPDEISGAENMNQEEEADKYSLGWFNNHVIKHNAIGLIPLVIDEIKETQKLYKTKRESLLKHG